MIRKFGEFEGQDVNKAVLRNGDVSVSILNYGCVTQDWRVATPSGERPVVLGFEAFDDYPAHSRSFGILAGRVANRTAFGRFEMDGVAYQLPVNDAGHHLHGGVIGLGRRMWRMEADGDARIQLTYRSPDGEEGYPGAVDFTVTVSLDGHRLTYDMSGVPDRPTPINLAQHSYYNLGGGDHVRDHTLWLDAAQYTPVGPGLIPTGEILPVAGTHFDFQKASQMGAIDPAGLGIDLNMILSPDRDHGKPAAIVTHPGGLELKLWTDQPGLQVFNAPNLDVPVPGLEGKRYGSFCGLCLEAQHFPDALNHPHFPSIIATPDRPYRQKLTIEIG